MRKIYINIGISVLIILGLNSCGTGFLETDPTTDIPENEYFISEEKLQGSLNAAYQPLLWADWAFGQYNPLMLLGDFMGEDLNPGGANTSDNANWHRMNTFSCTPEYTPHSLWVVFFSGVDRANIVIQNKDNIRGVSESKINRVYAEALTLRAYYYHWLWRFWGNIPHYNTNPSNPYLVDQMPADEVYKKIMADLDEALAGDKLATSFPDTQLGFVTKAMAQMLRANLVLYQNDNSRYETVLKDMKDIINSGQYKLYPNFAQIWEVENEWCSESIFEINYTDQTTARSWDNPLGAGGTVTPQLIGINGLSGASEYNSGWGFGNVSKELYDSYDSEDTRKDGGILNFEVLKKTNPSASYTPRYQDTGYFLKKYLPRKDGNAKNKGVKELNYNNNYRVYRVAEAYLIASEMIVRTNGAQSEADYYLNAVRARAYGMDANSAEFVPYRKVATLDNLLEEYRLEFIGEGHRYWDLVRFGKAEQILGGRGYTANKKHLPISRSEIDQAQGTLTQNPY